MDGTGGGGAPMYGTARLRGGSSAPLPPPRAAGLLSADGTAAAREVRARLLAFATRGSGGRGAVESKQGDGGDESRTLVRNTIGDDVAGRVGSAETRADSLRSTPVDRLDGLATQLDSSVALPGQTARTVGQALGAEDGGRASRTPAAGAAGDVSSGPSSPFFTPIDGSQRTGGDGGPRVDGAGGRGFGGARVGSPGFPLLGTSLHGRNASSSSYADARRLLDSGLSSDEDGENAGGNPHSLLPLPPLSPSDGGSGGRVTTPRGDSFDRTCPFSGLGCPYVTKVGMESNAVGAFNTHFRLCPILGQISRRTVGSEGWMAKHDDCARCAGQRGLLWCRWCVTVGKSKRASEFRSKHSTCGGSIQAALEGTSRGAATQEDGVDDERDEHHPDVSGNVSNSAGAGSEPGAVQAAPQASGAASAEVGGGADVGDRSSQNRKAKGATTGAAATSGKPRAPRNSSAARAPRKGETQNDSFAAQVRICLDAIADSKRLGAQNGGAAGGGGAAELKGCDDRALGALRCIYGLCARRSKRRGNSTVLRLNGAWASADGDSPSGGAGGARGRDSATSATPPGAREGAAAAAAADGGGRGGAPALILSGGAVALGGEEASSPGGAALGNGEGVGNASPGGGPAARAAGETQPGSTFSQPTGVKAMMRISRLLGNGVNPVSIGKAARYLDGIEAKWSPVDAATVATLRRLFPTEGVWTWWNNDGRACTRSEIHDVAFTEETVESYLTSRSDTTAPGRSGLAFAELKRVWRSLAVADKGALCALLEVIGNGHLPDSMAQTRRELLGLRGIAFPKEGGCGLRPIGVGEVLLSLVCGIMWRASKDALTELAGGNLALGGFAGTEIATHVVTAALAADPTTIAIAIDVENAFGTVARASIARELVGAIRGGDEKAMRLVPVLRLFGWLYGKEGLAMEFVNPSTGYDAVINIVEGVPQGNQLSQAFFAVALAVAQKELVRRLPRDTLLALPTFADDQFPLVRTAHQVRAVLEAMVPALAEVGLALGVKKTRVYRPARDDADHEALCSVCDEFGIPYRDLPAEERGIMVVGTPIGTQAYTRSKLDGLVGKARRLITRLEDVLKVEGAAGVGESEKSNLQGAFAVLRLCVQSKLAYLGRTVDPEMFCPYAERLDSAVFEAALRLVGIKPGDSTMVSGTSTAALERKRQLLYDQLHLPMAMGGGGFRELGGLSANAAYLASFAAASSAIRSLLRDAALAPIAGGGEEVLNGGSMRQWPRLHASASRAWLGCRMPRAKAQPMRWTMGRPALATSRAR